MLHTRIIASCTLGFALLGMNRTNAQVEYSVVELPTLNSERMRPHDINNFGEVVGDYGNFERPFLYSNGATVDLLTLSGHSVGLGTAYSINDNRDVVGVAIISGWQDWRAAKWSDGNIQNLGLLPNYNGGSRGTGINNEGVVVGWCWDMLTLPTNAFRWTSAGGMFNLGTLGWPGATSRAHAISDTGVIVGTSQTTGPEFYPCRFVPGGVNVLLPTLGLEGSAQAVSNGGVVVGYYGPPFSDFQPAMWINENRIDLERLPGDTSAEALGINSSNIIVGRSGGKAVIWDSSGVPTDLNTLITGNSGIMLNAAVSINDSGQILCQGSIGGQSVSRAFVVSPVTIQALDPTRIPGFLTGADVTTNLDNLGQGQSSGVIGMTCDGVTRVVLRVRGLPADGNVTFQIMDENGFGTDVGKLRSPGGSEDTALLTVPVSTLEAIRKPV